jgi:hypothetical protein
VSYCEVFTFKDGKIDESVRFKNAWGGHAFIWECLYNKYLKNPLIPYDSWLGKNSEKLWKLPERNDLRDFERAVLISTFDYAIVRKKNLRPFMHDLISFETVYKRVESGVCHLSSYVEWIHSHEDAEAIGFYGTSVSENIWRRWNEETEEEILYDLNTMDKHFEVYEYFDQLKGEICQKKE